jgi:HD-GYP domain-containing protein (c-di-GMP phosphodiesterase class II)
MKKTLLVNDLKIGMTVVGVDRNWFETTLVSHHFTIRSNEDIERLRKNGIQKVSVEFIVDKGHIAKQDSPSKTVNKKPDTINSESLPPPEEGTTELPEPITKELSEIERIQKETAFILEGSFNEARMGRAMDTKKIREMVRQTIDMILQNKSSTSFLADISGNDDETFVHSANTMMLAVGYAIRKKYPEEEWMSWGMAASLHDLGKIFIPMEILKKPSRLTPEEWEQMRKHPLLGSQFLKKSPEPDLRNLAAKDAVEHHERHGGKGYPYGLELPSIHPVSQGIMVLDVYEALTADRVYRKGMTPHKAMSFLLQNNMGLDRDISRTLANMVGIYPVGTLIGVSGGEIGVLLGYQGDDVVTGMAKILVLFSARQTFLEKPYTIELAIGTNERHFPTYSTHDIGITQKQLISYILKFSQA